MTKVQLLTETDKPIYEVKSVMASYSQTLVSKGWVWIELNDPNRQWFGGLNKRDFMVIHD